MKGDLFGPRGGRNKYVDEKGDEVKVKGIIVTYRRFINYLRDARIRSKRLGCGVDRRGGGRCGVAGGAGGEGAVARCWGSGWTGRGARSRQR